MSDQNPFAVEPEPEVVVEPIPTWVLVVSIIAAILGGFGLIGSCFGGLSLFASEQMMTFMPPETQEAAKEVLAIQFIPTLIQTALGMLLSVALVVAAIGCFTRKPWSQGWMRLTLMGCLFSALLGMAIQIWMIAFHGDKLVKMSQSPAMAEDQAAVVFYVGQGFGFVFSAVVLGFYIFGLIYFGKPSVTEFFERQSRLSR